jgi:hypothetical protein
MFFSIIGFIVGIFGTTLDSLSAKLFEIQKSCASYSTQTAYGGSSFEKSNALFCASFHTHNSCSCVPVSFFLYTSDISCYVLNYNLASSSSNCGQILSEYTPDLLVSSILNGILTFILLVYAILTCVTVCCAHPPPPSGLTLHRSLSFFLNFYGNSTVIVNYQYPQVEESITNTAIGCGDPACAYDGGDSDQCSIFNKPAAFVF